jgi:hypothetical protein
MESEMKSDSRINGQHETAVQARLKMPFAFLSIYTLLQPGKSN